MSNDVEERKELKQIINEMAQAAYRALDEPRNAEKGGWHGDSMNALFNRADEEFEEFEDSIKEDLGNDIQEAGDVLNFFAMIVDNHRRK